MAARIARQPRSIVLIGAPSSAAASRPGAEKAPEFLRAAGLADQLRGVGFEITDLGDCTMGLYRSDDENPRARNLPDVLRVLESLRHIVEQAVRTGGLPVILGGDCSIAVATLAGLRAHRHYPKLSLFYVDRDAELNVPPSSLSGLVESMVVAHIVGRGAAELVRFSGEPPLVREPNLVLFGIDRLDAPEREWMARSALHRYWASDILHKDPTDIAQSALESIHSTENAFVLHLDVDVMSADEMPAVDRPAEGGLPLSYVRDVLMHVARRPQLAAFEIAGYNPEKDGAERASAGRLVALILDAMRARLDAQSVDEPSVPAPRGDAGLAAEVGIGDRGFRAAVETDAPQTGPNSAAAPEGSSAAELPDEEQSGGDSTVGPEHSDV